jgi:hypothetical protein
MVSQRKKVDKKSRSPTIISPLKDIPESTHLAPEMAKLRPERSVLTSNEIFVEAPVELCFGMLASQLKQPSDWDQIVASAHPVSGVTGQVGAMSQVTLNIGGKKLESTAKIFRYRTNRSISWVLIQNPKVREDWHLDVKPHGVVVRVALGYEFTDQIINHLQYKIRSSKKVENDLYETLAKFKAVAEGMSYNDKTIGR